MEYLGISCIPYVFEVMHQKANFQVTKSNRTYPFYLTLNMFQALLKITTHPAALHRADLSLRFADDVTAKLRRVSVCEPPENGLANSFGYNNTKCRVT